MFVEYNDKMAAIGMQCSQLDVELEDQFSQIQDEYIEEVDQVYVDKVCRMREVSEKYDYEIYKGKDVGEMKQRKEKELQDIEEEFEKRKNVVVEEYKAKVDLAKESFVKKKQEFLIGSKVISDMKESIQKILNRCIERDEGKGILANI